MSVSCQLRSAIDRIELEVIVLPGLNDSCWLIGCPYHSPSEIDVGRVFCLRHCSAQTLLLYIHVVQHPRYVKGQMQQNIGWMGWSSLHVMLLWTGHSPCLRADAWADAFQTLCPPHPLWAVALQKWDLPREWSLGFSFSSYERIHIPYLFLSLKSAE